MVLVEIGTRCFKERNLIKESGYALIEWRSLGHSCVEISKRVGWDDTI